MSETIREQFKLFLVNPILLSCVFSWIGTQFLKTAIYLIYGKIHTFPDLLVVNMMLTTGYDVKRLKKMHQLNVKNKKYKNFKAHIY